LVIECVELQDAAEESASEVVLLRHCRRFAAEVAAGSKSHTFAADEQEHYSYWHHQTPLKDAAAAVAVEHCFLVAEAEAVEDDVFVAAEAAVEALGNAVVANYSAEVAGGGAAHLSKPHY